MSEAPPLNQEFATPYSEKSHSNRHEQTLVSARGMLGPLFALHQFDSVVDVGCGVGTWLGVCREYGASRVAGIEGLWFDQKKSVIGDLITKSDLEGPLPMLGQFDLAISLEVGEHLSPPRAESFVADITRLAGTILFGAAIPGQGGAGHFNEQWPSYWAGLYQQHGYYPVETIRRRVWNKNDIRIWYRENTLLYVSERSPLYRLYRPLESLEVLDVVHPQMFESRRKKTKQEAEALERATPPADNSAAVQHKVKVVPPGPEGKAPPETSIEKPAVRHAEVAKVLELLGTAVRDHKRFSLVRLSHCEAKFLNLEDMTSLEIRRSLKRQWGYTDVEQEHLAAVSAGIKNAVRDADIVGLPVLTARKLSQIDEDGGIRLWSLVRPALERDSLLRPDVLEAPLSINSDMAKAGLLELLRKEGASLGIVGCRDLRPVLRQMGFSDVNFISVPEAARTRDPDVLVPRHYPEAYLQIIDQIWADKTHRVYFVGAGFLGKIYCAEIAKAGSIALDMGSMLDLWAGVASRRGHTPAVVDHWKLNSPDSR